MNLDRWIFIATDTLRSRAYAQAMAARSYKLLESIWIRAPQQPPVDNVPSSSECRDFGNILVPDLSCPLEDTLSKISANVTTLDHGTVNHQDVAGILASYSADIAVYSGFGGEIVKPFILAAAPPLLHLHGGWLPDYRGSTTNYYSYLQEQQFGVSAILLREKIDTGPIVARRKYPPPPPGADVDHMYDSAIRADLLCRVISKYIENGCSPTKTIQAQDQDRGRTYYVIHPVLKHIALNHINGLN